MGFGGEFPRCGRAWCSVVGALPDDDGRDGFGDSGLDALRQGDTVLHLLVIGFAVWLAVALTAGMLIGACIRLHTEGTQAPRARSIPADSSDRSSARAGLAAMPGSSGALI